jgi:signal transduction histidine kinase
MPNTSLDRARLERLIEVGRGLLSELDLDAVLDSVLETARALTGAQYAALGILDERRRELQQFLTRGIDEETHREIGDLPRGRGILGVLIDEPRPLRIPDVAMHPRSYGFPPGHPQMSTFLGVPIVIRGEAWGNLYLTEKEGGGEFDQDDEETVIVLSDWAAIAIENARLYQAVDSRRAELERAVRGFEATATIARAVGGETNLQRVLELIVKRGRALVEARDVLILLREGDELVVAAGAGQVSLDSRPRIPAEGSAPAEALRARQARRIADVETQFGVPAAAVGVPDATTALLVPLVYRGTALGVLVAFDRLAGDVRFRADDEEVLKAFAASAATAVATAKTVEADRLRRSIEAAEAERRRWARELHDETLQGLGGLRVLLSGALRRDDAAMRAAVAAAVEHVTGEIDNLRAIIAELRPAALDQLGLVPALTSLAQRTESVQGLEVATDLMLRDEGARLPPEVETTVYRLVQESLTNVTKHARARRVQVQLREAGGALHVRVADDGTGFDPDAPSSGFGVLGMRERVELAGGELHIERGNPGTVVRARLPVPVG